MICPKCSADLLSDYTFCPQCGSKLTQQEEQMDSVSVGEITEAEAEYSDAEYSDADVNSEQDIQPLPVSPLMQTMPPSPVSQRRFPFPAFPTVSEETFVSEPTAASSPVDALPVAAAAPETPKVSDPEPERAGQILSPPKVDPFVPKEYRPLTTAGVFWYFFLICIPVVGWVCLLAFALAGKNIGKKSLSRAILIYWLLFLIVLCLAFIAGFIFDRNLLVQLFDQNNWTNLADFIFQTFIIR